MKPGLERQTGQVKHGGKKIHADDGLVGTAAWLRNSWSANDGRLAHPSFVEPTLARPKRRIATGPGTSQGAQATIVAEENDHRVVGDLELVQLVQIVQSSNLKVEKFSWRRRITLLGALLGVMAQAVGVLTAYPLQHHLHSIVHCIRGEKRRKEPTCHP